MGLARHRRVERIEAAGGIEQQRRSIAAARAGEHDLRAQPLQPRALKLLQRAQLRHRQELERGVRGRRLELGLRSGQRPSTARGRIRGQLCRSLEKGGRRRDAATGRRPPRRTLELRGDVLIRSVRRVRAMPRPAVGVAIRVGHIGQRPMDLLPFRRGRRTVGRRADERVPEPDARIDLEQSLCRGGRCRLDPDAELLGCAPHERRVADGLGRGREQEPPGLRWEGLEPPPEALLDAARHRHGLGHPVAAGELCGRHRARQLQQRERVAARLGDDAAPHPLIEVDVGRGLEQRARIGIGQAPHRHVRQSRKLALVADLADREDHGDRLGLQTARDERQRLRRRTVEPLRVVDDAQQRPVPRRLGAQAEHCEADEESIGWVAGAEAEGGAQRFALGAGQRIKVVQQRRAELLQPGVGELHLGLGARRSDDVAPGCLVHQILQQRGLADPGFPAQHEHRAPARTQVSQQPIERLALSTPPEQWAAWITFCHGRARA